MGVQYQYVSENEMPERLFYDRDNQTELLNPQLSLDFRKNVQYQIAGFSLRRNTKKFKSEIGAKWQRTSLKGIINNEDSLRSYFSNVLPSIALDLRLKKGKRLEIDYNTNVRIPRLEELSPIPDNSNPQYQYAGNPILRPEYNHSLQFRFNFFDNFNFTNLFSHLTLNYSKSKIVYQSEIDNQLFTKVTPINSDRYLNATSYLSFSKPFRPLNLKYSMRVIFNKSNYDSFLNNDRSVIDENNLNLKFALQNRKTDYVFMEVGITWDRNSRAYQIDPTFNQVFYSLNYFLDNEFYLPKGFTFSTSLIYDNYSSNGFENAPAILEWNASVKKLFFKNKVELSFSVQDILNQRIGYERSGTGTSIREVSYETIGQLFLIGINYKLGKGQKKSGIQVEFE